MLQEQKNINLTENKIHDIGNHFKDTLSRGTGKSSIGWFCTYTPEELIIAGGFTPVRIAGNKKISRSESYFPINFCPYVKSLWEVLMDSAADFRGFIFTNSCDGMRRFYDIASNYLKDTPLFLLDVPHLKDSDSIEFFAGNIKHIKAFIENLKGDKITGRHIEKALLITERKRKLLKELNNLLKNHPGILNISTYHEIMELSFLSEPEIFSADLEKYLKFLKGSSAAHEVVYHDNQKYTPSIMIIGNYISEKKLWEILSTMNIRLAFDDLCTTSRYFENLISPNNNPDILKIIAESYLNKPPCMRMADLGFKISGIKKNIIENNITGVIFISLKFCDNMLYSFPLIKKTLKEMGIPVLYLEIEYNNFSEGQIKTRIQAFLEML